MFDNLLGEADQHNAYLDLSRDSNPFVSSQVIKNREGNYLTGGGNLANSIDNYGSFTSLTHIVGKTKPKLKQGTKVNLEMLVCCFFLIANLVHESSDVALTIL